MPATGETIVKDPNASIFYGMDWTRWLASGVTIATSTWSVTDGDAALTLDHDSIVLGATATQVRLTGGTAERVYTVTNRITTDELLPQTDDRSFYVRVRDR